MKEPYLSNELIKLRNIEPEDLDIMYRIENDPQLWEISSVTVPYSRYMLKQYIETSQCDIFADRQLRLMIECNKDHRIMGAVDLTDFDPLHNRAAVGIVVSEEFRHAGIAHQALSLLGEYCFGFLHLKQLYAYITSGNEYSMRLFTSCGFIQSGILKAWVQTEKGYQDAYLMQRVNP